jgi:hypothetical protein
MSYEELLEAVQNYFSDTSREPGETKQGLKSLIEEIKILVETL